MTSGTAQCVHLLSQEEFFGEDESGGLPTFNSLTMENQNIQYQIRRRQSM